MFEVKSRSDQIESTYECGLVDLLEAGGGAHALARRRGERTTSQHCERCEGVRGRGERCGREGVRKGMGEVVVIAASCSCKSESSNQPFTSAPAKPGSWRALLARPGRAVVLRFRIPHSLHPPPHSSVLAKRPAGLDRNRRESFIHGGRHFFS